MAGGARPLRAEGDDPARSTRPRTTRRDSTDASVRTAEDVPNAAFQSRRDSDSDAATANVLGTKDSRVRQRFGMTPHARPPGGQRAPSAVQVRAGTLDPPWV